MDNITNQPSKFRTKNWVKVNDDAHGKYNTKSQIKFKTSMLKLSSCDHSDAYILAKGTVRVSNTAATATATKNANKNVISKNCAPIQAA